VKPNWVKQDPALINSDVCIRCGRCCKATLQVHQPFPIDENHRKQKVDYIATIFDDVKGIKVIDISNDRTQKTRVMLQKKCPKLDKNDHGHLICSIYEKRPAVCSSFNCIQTANHKESPPEDWEEIKKLIEQYPTEGVELLS